MAVTAHQLRAIVAYNPATGTFTWKVSRGYRGIRCKAGDRAGGFNTKLGYRVIGIDGRSYLEHRLAFLYMTGCWPDEVVDHIDRDRTNNAWANLRAADRAQNRANTDYKKPGATSALRGVSWHRRAGKWQAHIRVAAKSTYLGLFESEDLAHAAYCEAARTAFGEFANV